MATKSPIVKTGNQEVAATLAGIDYRNLTGAAWARYQALTLGALAIPENKVESRSNPRTGGLPANQMFDFEVYRCAAVKRELYPGMPNTPIYIDGVQLTTGTPEGSTRCTIKAANDLNQQVSNYAPNTPGLIYLIKKVPVEVAETVVEQTAEAAPMPAPANRKR